jgi:N-acetylglucosaminyl-diphospho-decaprenol L-rhamnosyltransferase
MTDARAAGVAGGTLGIIVVNFGSHELLLANIATVDLSLVPAQVFVVDNFKSHPDTASIAELARDQGWALIQMSSNVGFGSAANIGMKAASDQGCESFLILNPDVRLDAWVLRELRTAAGANHTALITPVIERPDGSVWFSGSRVSLDEAGIRAADGPPTARTLDWLTGACLAAHSSLWTSLGGFDEDYFLYWEDVDLSVRCLALGGSLVIRDDLRVVHDVGATQEGGSRRAKSAVYYYYNCRNRLLFAAKHLNGADRRRWVLRTPLDARRVVLRGGRRQLLAPGRSIWPAVRGSASGLMTMHRPGRQVSNTKSVRT